MIKLFNRGRLIFAALAAVVMTLCLPATAEEANEGSVIEEIVVTATYRDTDMMDTPLSITALTDVEIEQRGIEDIMTLFLAVPGLNYGQAAPTWHYVVARGIAQFRAPTGPVSFYVDNVPVQGQGARSPQMPNFDLERIEVLKGPQGTLYGEGSMAASVRYITKKPNPEGFDYGYSVRINDPEHSRDIGYRVDSMVNIPISDNMALRLTPFSRKKPGIIDKYGPTIMRDVNFRRENGVRAQLAFYPSDDLTITAMYYNVDAVHGAPGTAFHCYVDDRPADGNLAPGDFVAAVPHYPITQGLAGGASWIHANGCEYGPNGTFDGETARFKAGPKHVYVTHHGSPQFNNGGFSHSTIFNLTVEYTTPWGDLTVSSGKYDHEIAHSEEQRIGGRFGTLPGGRWPEMVDAACVIVGCKPGMFWGRSSAAGTDLNERVAHELRLVSNTDGRIQYTVGAFWQELENGDDPVDWEYCGKIGHQGQVIFGGPLYPDIVCKRGAHTYNPASGTLEQMRAVHRILMTGALKPNAAAYNVREEWSLFGEVSYNINEQWDILAGVRYSDSEFVNRTGPSGKWVPLSQTTPTTDKAKQTKQAPKVTVTWRPTDATMLYLTWAKAFRFGGVNSRLASRVVEYRELAAKGVAGAQTNYETAKELLTFGGDDVESWELGIKTTLLDGRVDIMANVYDMQIDNAVVTIKSNFPAIVDPSSIVPFADPYPISVNKNVGAALSRGMELEIRAQVTDDLSLRFGGSYIPDAETQTQAVTGLIGGAGGGGGIATNVDPGNRIRLTPVHAYSLTGIYQFQLAGLDGTARADVYYRGKKVYRTENNERPTPTYAFTNLKLLFSRDSYEIGVYVNNVTDTIAPYSLGDSGYHGFHPPRTYGLQFSYRN